MNIEETTELLNSLLSQANKKSEKKVYNCFIGTLASLKKKDLTENQIQLIQEKLSSLDLKATTDNRKKYFKQKLAEFKEFLKIEFSFTTAQHYTEIWMVYGVIFGTSIGTPLGIVFGDDLGTAIGSSTGTSLGMVFGMMYGAQKDAEAERQGKVV